MKNLINKNYLCFFVIALMLAIFILYFVLQSRELINKQKTLNQLQAQLELALKQNPLTEKTKEKKLDLASVVEFLLLSAKQQRLVIASLNPLKPEIIHHTQIIRIQLIATGFFKDWLHFLRLFSQNSPLILLKDFSITTTAQNRLHIEAELWVTNIANIKDKNFNLSAKNFHDPFYKSIELINFATL